MLGRLRARFNRMESQGTATMVDIRELAGAAKDLIDDLRDGFGVRVTVEAGAADELLKIAMGQAGHLPFTVVLDPTIDHDKER